MTLYEIDKAIVQCIDEETGEVDTEMLDALTMAKESKIENIALWIKDLKAEVEALKAEKMAFEKRQKAANNRLESLKNYLTYYLDGQKFKTTKCSVFYKNSKSVNIINETEIPPEYITSVEIHTDKNAIKQAIDNGKEVPGAEVVEKTSIQIK